MVIWEERYFINLNFHIFTTKSKETKCNSVHFAIFKNSENEEVTSPISGYQDQSNGARSTMKIQH